MDFSNPEARNQSGGVEPNAVLAAGLDYLQRGWSVVPVEDGKKKPASFWKRYQAERADEEQLRRWFDPTRGGRYTRLGIVLGLVSGRLCVRDFDDGERYDKWAEDYPEYAHSLPTVRTWRGVHVYFLNPIDSVLTKTLKFTDGELRYEGSIVVAPPSLHPEGRHYEWIVPIPVSGIPEIDPSEIGLLGDPVDKKRDKGANKNGPIREGQRNTSLASRAGSLRHRGVSLEAILADLLEMNRNQCDPPLSEQEVESIARSISQYQPDTGVTIRLTEMGNARRLVNRHGQDLRFVGLAKKWHAWDGRRWCPDDTGEVDRRMKDTARSIYQESIDCTDPEIRPKIAVWAIKSEANKIIRASIALAQSEPELAVLPSVFDTDPWLLNCLNGTLDLRTGKLKQHDRNDMISRLAPVEFRPGATCPLWQEFLDRITAGNRDLQAYLQRVVGYSLTGDANEQAIFILYGTGQNGKSKFLEMLRLLLGNYALNTPTKTHVVRSPNDATNEQDRLNGYRLVTAVEWEEGQKMAEGFVKQVTGGDTVTARFLNKEFVEFAPTFKLFLGTNHKPQIRGGDFAMKRRIRLIPFTVTIPESVRDKKIIEKLRPELSGILNWALEGCLEWQRTGLGEPADVTDATASYCEEMDVMGRFIAECCFERADIRTKAGTLFKKYIDWCSCNGEKPMTPTAFGMRLGERGYSKKKIKGIIEWSGIGLLTAETQPDQQGGGTVEDS